MTTNTDILKSNLVDFCEKNKTLFTRDEDMRDFLEAADDFLDFQAPRPATKEEIYANRKI